MDDDDDDTVFNSSSNAKETESKQRLQNRARFEENSVMEVRRSSLPDDINPTAVKPRPEYRRAATWSSRAFQRRTSYLESRRYSAAIHTPSLKYVAERGNWGSKWEFLLSCVGLSVGIGNVWRFPYLAYENGGGAFLIPYIIMLILAGKPMYFLELAFGQFAGLGPLAIWSCVPIAKGVGYAMVTVSLVVCIYYNVIMSYTIFYIASSFQSVVPWSECDPAWADMETCYVRGMSTNLTANGTERNRTSLRQTASLQYWERYVLAITPGLEESGGIKWDLALCLLLSWIIVVLCLMKGIKTSGKVVYFAATFPYLILIMLLINGLMLDGAIDGILYFITPTWSKLLDIKVWQAAAGQMFFSLSVSMGGLIMYSSYNDFRNNIYRDSLVVSVLDTITSLISGTVIFSVLGAMSHELDIPIDKVVASGPGLAFVTYPEALSRLPLPQLWSVLFFLMLFILGLDSEFALLENVLTSVSDEYPVLRNYKLYVCIGVSVCCYLLGLPCVTRSGQYVLELMDKYGGGTAVIFIAISECIAITWIYGLDRFCKDVFFMIGVKLGMYWKVSWLILSPIILSFIFIYSMASHEPAKYGDYDYPDWADGVGWILAVVSMIQVPLWAIVTVCRQKGPTISKKIKQALKPTEEWGPSDSELKEDWLSTHSDPDSVSMKAYFYQCTHRVTSIFNCIVSACKCRK